MKMEKYEDGKGKKEQGCVWKTVSREARKQPDETGWRWPESESKPYLV